MKAVSAQVVSCCVLLQTPKIMQHMHDFIPCMFDYCADMLVHLLLQKSSMVGENLLNTTLELYLTRRVLLGTTLVLSIRYIRDIFIRLANGEIVSYLYFKL